ncbi:MAG TPA: hypothetical protein VG755_01210 [Nannocystaceae bacterium]|nr:hypothetical protein [Nannocystaceae bacterium]
MARAVRMVVLVATSWLAACRCSDQSAPAQASPVVAEPNAPAAAPADDKAAPPALSEEDLRLLAADPATLTPEERRKRAYALRRKIMQNPDSPTARMLEDLRRAHENGELDVQKPGEGAHFEVRGSGPPKDGPPPAGTRPPAGSDPASGAP